jgi:TM2 domain-containing membrane protein YozV
MSYYRPPKDKCTACVLLLFGGVFGLHRFYLDDICCGIAYLLTGGWCVIGVLTDCCYLSSLVSAANMRYAVVAGPPQTQTTVVHILQDPHFQQGYAPPPPPGYSGAVAYSQLPVQQTPYYAPRPGAQLPYYAPPEVTLAPPPSAPVVGPEIAGGAKQLTY